MKLDYDKKPIVFLPGYGENTDMSEPFCSVLRARTGRDVIVGDYYNSNVRKEQKLDSFSPSRMLANRVLQQLQDNNVQLGDVVTHSYGSMVADQLYDSLAPDSRVAMIAPAGIGKSDPGLPPRFIVGMTRELLKHPVQIKNSLRGAANIVRSPAKSMAESIELTRASNLVNVRKLGERAIVIVYANDPVFDDEKTAQILCADENSEVAVMSPLIETANHCSLFMEPDETARIVAQHLSS